MHAYQPLAKVLLSLLNTWGNWFNGNRTRVQLPTLDCRDSISKVNITVSETRLITVTQNSKSGQFKSFRTFRECADFASDSCFQWVRMQSKNVVPLKHHPKEAVVRTSLALSKQNPPHLIPQKTNNPPTTGEVILQSNSESSISRVSECVNIGFLGVYYNCFHPHVAGSYWEGEIVDRKRYFNILFIESNLSSFPFGFCNFFNQCMQKLKLSSDFQLQLRGNFVSIVTTFQNWFCSTLALNLIFL